MNGMRVCLDCVAAPVCLCEPVSVMLSPTVIREINEGPRAGISKIDINEALRGRQCQVWILEVNLCVFSRRAG
jgi:hypothetical protein